MSNKKQHMLSVRVQDVILLALETLAAQSDRPLSWHMRQALIMYLAQKAPHTLPNEMRERYEQQKTV